MNTQNAWIEGYRKKLDDLEKKKRKKSGRKSIKIRAIDPLKIKRKK